MPDTISTKTFRAARDLLRTWGGREIEKTDGLMAVFDSVANAAAFAVDYHHALAALGLPFKARAGVHVGPVTLRESSAADVAVGSKRLEAGGLGPGSGHPGVRTSASRREPVDLGAQLLGGVGPCGAVRSDRDRLGVRRQRRDGAVRRACARGGEDPRRASEREGRRQRADDRVPLLRRRLQPPRPCSRRVASWSRTEFWRSSTPSERRTISQSAST